MTPTLPPYGQSLSLLTDLYELTMACGYWKTGLADREAVFHLYFRNHPFGGDYTVACGLGPAVAFLRGFHFDESDLDYLRGLRAADASPLLDPAFLHALSQFKFRCDVDAIPEGSIVFPQEPLPHPRAAASVSDPGDGAAEHRQLPDADRNQGLSHRGSGARRAGAGVWLRRAQGWTAPSPPAAPPTGGCAGTSNVLAGKLYGIPVRGTHAHSWVMSFEDELTAFETWALDAEQLRVPGGHL